MASAIALGFVMQFISSRRYTYCAKNYQSVAHSCHLTAAGCTPPARGRTVDHVLVPTLTFTFTRALLASFRASTAES
ncbi:hypothetical protein KXW36_001247, partial [Aspergillus fumigatus]